MDPAELRRRKNMSGQNNDSMEQPLLDRQEDEERKHRIIVHPGPFNLSSFLKYVLSCWQMMLGALFACMGSAPRKLSLIQMERIERLRERAAEPFRPEDEDHCALLKQLWSQAFPDIAFTKQKSAQWKEMGWQGEDPATDIRGAGRLGLDCLLYLAAEAPPTWRRLLGKLDGERSDWEYPFAVAGLNITFMLLDVIGLHQHAAAAASRGRDAHEAAVVASTPAGRGFVGLLSAEPFAFEELFIATFECLDREWLRQRASYMEFNSIVKAVRSQVERALITQPLGISAMRQKLL